MTLDELAKLDFVVVVGVGVVVVLYCRMMRKRVAGYYTRHQDLPNVRECSKSSW